MLSTWVLVIAVAYTAPGGGGIAMHDFMTQKLCERASEWIQNNLAAEMSDSKERPGTVRWFYVGCFPK